MSNQNKQVYKLDEIDSKWDELFTQLQAEEEEVKEKAQEVNKRMERLNHEAKELWMNFRDEFQLEDHRFNFDNEERTITATPKPEEPEKPEKPETFNSNEQMNAQMRTQLKKQEKQNPINRLMKWIGLN
jgi:glucan-binding YG repeat protein